MDSRCADVSELSVEVGFDGAISLRDPVFDASKVMYVTVQDIRTRVTANTFKY